jgi:hypothetical protein
MTAGVTDPAAIAANQASIAALAGAEPLFFWWARPSALQPWPFPFLSLFSYGLAAKIRGGASGYFPLALILHALI